MSADEQEEQRSVREELSETLDVALRGPHAGLVKALEGVHAADLAEVLLDVSERDAWQVFDSLDLELSAAVLAEAEDSLREDLVEQLTPRQLARLVQEMAPDDVVDLLALVDKAVADRVLHSVDFELARDLRELAAYPHDSAGGMMTTEFVTVTLGARIGDAIKQLKQEAEDAEHGEGLFVVDEDSRPVGYIADRGLLTHSIHETVDAVMTDAISVSVTLDQEDVAHQLLHYSLQEIGVTDAEGRLVGVVSYDDAQDVLEEEASEDILRLVGTSPQLQTRLAIHRRVLARLPLQGVTVLGGLVTAWLIELVLKSQSGGAELSAGADLLRFIPIIIGLAGNVGIQASTILVRAFATGEVESDRELSVLGSESLVGLVIGLICGGATFAAIFVSGDGADSLNFGLAIGLAIASAVTWAAFLGCLVPMTCRRIGIDPAIVAGPFLITVSDISGTALYLGVASLLVGV